jgi:hypothetical protein
MRFYTANADSDVSYGALRLLDPTLPPPGELQAVVGIPHDLREYRARWRSEVEGKGVHRLEWSVAGVTKSKNKKTGGAKSLTPAGRSF